MRRPKEHLGCESGVLDFVPREGEIGNCYHVMLGMKCEASHTE